MKRKPLPRPDLAEIQPILIKQWRRLHDLTGPLDCLQTREFKQFIENLKKLQSLGWKGPHLSTDKQLLGAYLLYPWVIHYQEGLSLIGEMPTPPRRVLDLASGAAPLAFAALRHGAQEALAVDDQRHLLEIGAKLCGAYGYPLTIRSWEELETPVSARDKFDLILMGDILDTIFPSGLQNAAAWFSKITKFLSDDGMILITDRSQDAINARFLALRDILVEASFPVQAPCLYRGKCPALASKNPCYAQREMEKTEFLKNIQRSCSINLGSLKMSYLLLRHPKAPWPSERQDLFRVISPPVEIHRGKRFYLCGAPGRKSLESQLPETPSTAKAFDHLKRGELIEINGAIAQRNALFLSDTTSVTIAAACGKPLVDIDYSNS